MSCKGGYTDTVMGDAEIDGVLVAEDEKVENDEDTKEREGWPQQAHEQPG